MNSKIIDVYLKALLVIFIVGFSSSLYAVVDDHAEHGHEHEHD